MFAAWVAAQRLLPHRPAMCWGRCARLSALLETWLVQEYADKGSLSGAIKAGRFRRRLDGSLDAISVLKCLNDVASGARPLHCAARPGGAI